MAPWLRTHLPMQKALETWVWSLRQEDPLQQEMAMHSSILAWKIPRTEEPDWLQSVSLQRIEHDWATERTHTHTHTHTHTSKYFRHGGHTDSVKATQLCHGSTKAASGNTLTNEWHRVLVKCYQHDQGVDQTWLVSYGLSALVLEHGLWLLIFVRFSLSTLTAGG